MLTGSNKKRFTALPGLKKAMALVVVLAMLMLCFAGTVFAVDLTTPNSLTVNVQDGFKDDDTLKAEDLIVDLYLVAEAKNDIEPAKGYDTYTLVASSAFADLQEAIDKAQVKVEEATEENPDNKTQWEDIAQEAVKLVRDEKAGKPAQSGIVGEATKNIQAGLYLVLTHSPEDVIKENEYDSYFFDNDGKDPVSTIGLSDTYEYHFTPQLIALPFKGDGTEDTFNTEAAAGDWKNELTVVLKGDRTERFVSIRVVKNLTAKETDATFVFDVEAVNKKGESVYSNTFTLNFFGEGTTNSFTVEKKIPVGSTVTVTEVYEGASYELVSVTPGNVIEDIAFSENVYEFAFVNRPVDGPGGTGILNTFTNNGESWVWDPDYNRDSSSAVSSADGQ